MPNVGHNYRHMSRQLIPPNVRDRRFAIWGICAGASAVFFLQVDQTVVAVIEGACAIALLTLAYVFQEPKDQCQATDYSGMIKLITETQGSFDKLKQFLEAERQRVSQAQRALEELNEERRELEPVVATHRETVEAILLAHHKKTRGAKWKEWILAFCLGVASSLIAGYLLNLLPSGDGLQPRLE
jgi:hypothetical protein